MARSEARSTSLTKSAGDLVSQVSWSRLAAPARTISAPRTAAATQVARSPRRSTRAASESDGVACEGSGALIASRNVSNFQRNTAFGRAAHRQLPRGREELGAIAAPAPDHHLHRGLSRHHGGVRSRPAARAAPRHGDLAAGG